MEKLIKKFTDTAKWLTTEEVKLLIEHFEQQKASDENRHVLNYLHNMLKEGFCIRG